MVKGEQQLQRDRCVRHDYTGHTLDAKWWLVMIWCARGNAAVGYITLGPSLSLCGADDWGRGI